MRSCIGPKAKKGFTIIELLVAGAILAIVLAIMYGLYVQGLDMSMTARYQAELQSQSRNALASMVTELRNVTRVSSLSPSPNAAIPAMPNNTSVTFYLPDIDESGNISWGTGPSNQVSYAYDAAQQALTRNWVQEGAARSSLLASNVSSVQFKDITMDNTLGINEIVIALTLSKTTRNNRAVAVSQRALVTLRN